jgi:ABC-2 type transport system permease protein
VTQIAPPSTIPPGHYRARSVLRSEWTKLRSVRSTVWSLVALVIVTILVGALVTNSDASNWAHSNVLDRFTFDPTNDSLAGLSLGQLAIGVLGILAITTEHATGTIRATLAAVPNRPLVLATKSFVFGLVALIVGEVVCFAAFLTGQAILSGRAPNASLDQPGVLRAVVLAGVYLAVIGLIALGIGTIIRHTAGAITTFVALLLVFPLILQAFPTSIREPVTKFLPITIGRSMASVHPTFDAFTPWVSFAVVGIYLVVVMAAACWLFAKRDA